VTETQLDWGPLDRSPQQEREFEASLRLREWVREHIDGAAKTEWQMTPGAIENVFIGTFAKGTKTWGAAMLLCDRGYGQQAEMLTRSLFEHAVVAWWMLLCVEDEDWVMQALRDHRSHARVLYERAFEIHPELDSKFEDADLDENEVAALDDRFGRFGGNWHGKRLDELVREIEEREDQRYATIFWKFFRLVNHHNNYTLHHSAVGISNAVHWEDPEETPLLELGPSERWISSTLWAATWCYGLLVVATLRRLSPTRADDFSDLLDEVGKSFISFSAAEVKDIGRNDACPCGSGMKFKRCHEAMVE
jgi:hypothetical protein